MSLIFVRLIPTQIGSTISCALDLIPRESLVGLGDTSKEERGACRSDAVINSTYYLLIANF